MGTGFSKRTQCQIL